MAVLEASKEQMRKLANKLKSESQIPHQYFQIGSLFLVNVSSSEDPDCNWEYEIYKLDDDGNAYLFEFYTVNAGTSLQLYEWLLNWERIPFSQMRDPITGKHITESHFEFIPAHKVERFKELFEGYSKQY